jgi:hypothetical protein
MVQFEVPKLIFKYQYRVAREAKEKPEKKFTSSIHLID